MMIQDDGGFGFNFLNEDEERVVREGLSEYPYLSMLKKLCPWNWKNQLESMNIKVDENNKKDMGMVKGQSQKVQRFSSNTFWNNIDSIISAPTFGLGGQRMCYK